MKCALHWVLVVEMAFFLTPEWMVVADAVIRKVGEEQAWGWGIWGGTLREVRLRCP